MGLFLNLLEQRSGTVCGDEGSSDAGSALTWILKLGPHFLLFLHRQLRFRCLGLVQGKPVPVAPVLAWPRPLSCHSKDSAKTATI